MRLNYIIINDTANDLSDHIARQMLLPRTIGDSINSLMLPTHCNQVFHWWIWATLRNRPQKLSTLGEPNSMVAILQIGIICNNAASNFNLLVDRHQEPICSVVYDGVSNFQ